MSEVLITPFDKRVVEAKKIAKNAINSFLEMFLLCLETPMSNQQFLTDDLHGFVNYPMKTTVGISPKYTSNRKFFANLMNTPAFKEILAKDINKMRLDFYKKLKYCDEATMDQRCTTPHNTPAYGQMTPARWCVVIRGDRIKAETYYSELNKKLQPLKHNFGDAALGSSSEKRTYRNKIQRRKNIYAVMSKQEEHLKYRLCSNDGPICGFIEQIDNKAYYRFKKIPYAKPPLGSLRFIPPVPVKPWNNELDCTEDAPPPASFFFQNKIMGSEDCLYIEVCTPKISPEELLPVMFWIGNIGFIINMDTILDPKLIVDRGVVFVRCGFRVGPFGFLSINEFLAPGNNGLKDIVMALQWVQRNIKAFGGDPNNVTLFGISSGGSIVHYMMLSPMATGLFHKGIIQSASAINNWSLEKNPIQPVMKLATELGIRKTDIVEIVKELKSVPYMDIMRASLKLIEKLQNLSAGKAFDSVFKPCIEREFEGVPVFLSKSPSIILKSGIVNKVPIMIGANNTEAMVLEYLEDNFNDIFKTNMDPYRIVPTPLAAQTFAKNIDRKILNFYLDGADTLREDKKQQYVQLMSDYYFLYNVNKTIRIHKEIAPECPIFFYIINCAGEWIVPKYLDFFNKSGHAAEIPFLFQVTLPDGSICKGSRDSITTRRRIIKMWTNFAKYSNPTPDENDSLLKITWDPVTSKDELDYLCIGQDLTKGVNPFEDRMLFWEQLHREHKFLRTITHFNDIGVLF
ncbi:unnamed protein product, partial [Iphiclides podalirius]